MKMAIQPCDHRVEYLKGAAADILVQGDIVDTKERDGILVNILYSHLHLVFIAYTNDMQCSQARTQFT